MVTPKDNGIFRIADNETLTTTLLSEYISAHKKLINGKYKKMLDAYTTKYDIFKQAKKEAWKPDNRIAVNFAKFCVDSFNGFFMGIPIKYTAEDDKVSEFITTASAYNTQDDIDAEISKNCDIFGHCYEMLYVDNDGNLASAAVTPMNGFIIYDEGIIPKPRYFVHTYKDTNNVLRGSYSDDGVVQYFTEDKGFKLDGEPIMHGFDGVPCVEYVENEERVGIFEPVMSMINAYNKAISEKANDADYFADAYLKILGAELSNDDIQHIRDDRIINFEGDGAEKLVVEFLQKPVADSLQENLINRLESLIFTISEVVNITDESFGTSSGIALKYKLLPMSNLANTKERKFKASMNKRYKLIFSNPISGMPRDAWATIRFVFTRNFPPDIEAEVNAAKNLEGMVTKETQLSILSIVPDPAGEAQAVEEERSVPSMLGAFE